MFAEIKTLPCSEDQTTATDGNRQAAPKKTRLDVRRHVIGPFQAVIERLRLWNNLIQGLFHVRADIAVRVFVDREAGGRMHQENIDKADLNDAQFVDLRDYLVRYQMTAAFSCSEPNCLLKPSIAPDLHSFRLPLSPQEFGSFASDYRS